MSGHIDVLAVMDAEIACKRIAVANGYSSEEVLNETEETRDAVAELIEADILLDRTQEAYDRASSGRIRNDMWADVIAARKRRAVAIARVGGAK